MPRYRYSPAQLEKMHGNPWLTDRERAAFELHYRRGWPIEDVAAELDVSRGDHQQRFGVDSAEDVIEKNSQMVSTTWEFCISHYSK